MPSRRSWIRLVDRASLVGMALSVLAMLEPWTGAGLRIGFFATLACTLVQIVASHLNAEPGAR